LVTADLIVSQFSGKTRTRITNNNRFIIIMNNPTLLEKQVKEFKGMMIDKKTISRLKLEVL